MKMEIAHTGRTGKDTSVTFDTERKIYICAREQHDVFIYAEQTRYVLGVINDLKRLSYQEVGYEEWNRRQSMDTDELVKEQIWR